MVPLSHTHFLFRRGVAEIKGPHPLVARVFNPYPLQIMALRKVALLLGFILLGHSAFSAEQRKSQSDSVEVF